MSIETKEKIIFAVLNIVGCAMATFVLFGGMLGIIGLLINHPIVK